MGKLLRGFWHPFAVSRELTDDTAQPVRLLGEDLTLYRGDSGRAYLVGGRCAHRLTVLHTGWVDGEHIRCMYHGWQYDGTGQCTARPAERDSILPNVKIPGYPVHEYAGLLFAYLGDGPIPPFDLLRKECFERPGAVVVARKQVFPCNWFQCVENALDAVHVSFVHARGREGRFVQKVTTAIPDLEYCETESGLRQIATRGPGNVRISDWSFPNSNHIVVPGYKDGPWADLDSWKVPVDDEHTMRLHSYAVAPMGSPIDEETAAYFQQHSSYDPSEHHDELFHGLYPEDAASNLTHAQDYVVQVGQGAIADRSQETLGRSDAGIALLRRIFWRELDALRSGEPMKVWKRSDPVRSVTS